MAGRCTICASEHRDAIDRGIAAGVSSYRLSDQYGLSASAIQRHAAKHLSPALSAVRTAKQEDKRATALDRVEVLISRAESLFNAAAVEGKFSQSLDALVELRRQVELIAKMTGELNDKPQVVINLLSSPEVMAALNVVYTELQDQPEVRQRIAARLQPDRLQIEAPR